MAAKARILVLDDEAVVCQSCSRILSQEGHVVEACQTAREGLAKMEQNVYDLLLVDLKMPEVGGMEVLRRVKEIRPETEVIMITGYPQIESAVEAMKLGAFDYVPKPFSPDQLLIAVAKAIERREILAENLYLRRELGSKYRFENLVGGGPKMQEVFHLVAQVAPTESTVLIRGESGTGKELLARAIHFNSRRKDRVFVPVDCGALSETLLESELFGHVKGAFTGAIAAKEGLFEVASGGTLFLDEIGNVSPAVQARLLRVLQEHEFKPVGDARARKTDVRVVAATNKDLEGMIAQGTFREELFYRLSIVPIHLPSLRERREDIPALAAHFLRRFAREVGRDVQEISPEALNLLVNHDWPGNVRELENAVHRAVILASGPAILSEHLPPGLHGETVHLRIPIPRTNEELNKRRRELREKSVEEVERAFVLGALKRDEWNVTRAAAEVGMQRQNFQAVMRKHGVRLAEGVSAQDSAPDEP